MTDDLHTIRTDNTETLKNVLKRIKEMEAILTELNSRLENDREFVKAARFNGEIK